MRTQIRLVEARDEARWSELFRGYLNFYSEDLPTAVIDLTWRRLAGQTDNMLCLVAVDDRDQAMGFAALVFHRSTWSSTWYCYLEDLFVDPSVRGHGIGRALIEATYVEADKRGATRTYWATQSGNRAARKLYDQVGQLTSFVQYRR